ncbi:MAG: hypothetical protein IJM30_06400 [Thermoguttaceae bacterium]|nr:hypothetical protein [Thermoguttaceae bacterium]
MENAPEIAETVLSEASSAASRARKSVYFLLILVGLGVGFGKIASVESVSDRAIQNYRLQQIPKTLETKAKELREKGVEGERLESELARVYASALADAQKARPTLCANDRSRWATIRALVEPEARVYRYAPVFSSEEKAKRVRKLNDANPESLGTIPFKYKSSELLRNTKYDCPEKFELANCKADRYAKKWVPYAIDKVWEDPLWDSIDVVKHGLKDEVYEPANPSSGYMYSSKPTLLPTIMAGPYWILRNVFGLSMADRPFETVRLLLIIYNLIPLGIALVCLASIVESLGRTDWGRYFAVAAGVFGSFALTFVATLNNHLPGFACVAISLWATMKIVREGKTRWLYFALAGFFGALAVACELPALAYAGALCLILLVRSPKRTVIVSIPFGLVVVAAFFGTNYLAHQSLVPAYAHKRDHMTLAALEATDQKDATGDAKLKFDPNDWYYYNYYPAGRPREAKSARLSHWANRTGIDKGEPSLARYALHSTIGLRGVFSLAPIWILSLVGALALLARSDGKRGGRALGGLTLVLTAVFIAFFLTRDQGDRNYGGVCCYPRWFFPLIPLFIPALAPVVDALSKSRLGRGIALLALFVSVAAAFYPTWSPWVSPWYYQWAVDWGLFEPY